MRSRTFRYCLSISQQSYRQSRPTTYLISLRHQSTTNDQTANLLQSDKSILDELQSFELSEEELTKISDANGATIVDGIEYLQPSGNNHKI